MKKTFLIALLAFVSTPAFAATIKSAKLDAAKENIVLEVAYGGGCEQAQFKLHVGGCLESFPVQCTANLVNEGKPDMCEAYIHDTVVISLKDAGLTDGYYERAKLTILGSGKSSAVLTLP